MSSSDVSQKPVQRLLDEGESFVSRSSKSNNNNRDNPIEEIRSSSSSSSDHNRKYNTELLNVRIIQNDDGYQILRFSLMSLI